MTPAEKNIIKKLFEDRGLDAAAYLVKMVALDRRDKMNEEIFLAGELVIKNFCNLKTYPGESEPTNDQQYLTATTHAFEEIFPPTVEPEAKKTSLIEKIFDFFKPNHPKKEQR